MGNYQTHTSEAFDYNGERVYVKFRRDGLITEGESGRTYLGRVKSVDSYWFQSSEPCIVKQRVQEERRQQHNRARKLTNILNVYNQSREMIIFPLPGFTTVKTCPGVFADDVVYEGAPLMIEPFLDGYSYFLSNSSTVNVRAGVPLSVLSVLTSFCHYTYDITDGEVLITGFKGVYQDNSFTLTDPAIHSCRKGKFGNYGPTDLGVYGMINFFSRHACNRLCKDLLKPHMSRIPRQLNQELDDFIKKAIPYRRDGSTYISELRNHGLTEEDLSRLHDRVATALAKKPNPIQKFDKVVHKKKRGTRK